MDNSVLAIKMGQGRQQVIGQVYLYGFIRLTLSTGKMGITIEYFPEQTHNVPDLGRPIQVLDISKSIRHIWGDRESP